MTSTTSVTSLLQDLRRHRPSSPRLIWYGTGSERVELSGRVLDNWVAKTSNLLADELDAGDGTTVLLDMPAHWRSLCWVLAAWQVGASVQLRQSGPAAGGDPDPAGAASDASGADIVVTTEPDEFAGATAPPQYLVAVALGALQMRWDGELPPDTVDYAGEVRSHADEYLALSEPAPTDEALRFGSTGVTYGQLFTGFARHELEPQTGRADTSPASGSPTVLASAGLPLAEVLQIALGSWSAGGSVVLVHPRVPVGESLINSERVTCRFGVDPD